MSDQHEIRVGDRFERENRPGVVFEVVEQRAGSLWNTRDVATGELSYSCSLRESWWRRLPREKTVEERRAALRPGDVIRDPALLRAGMRVQTDNVREDRVLSRLAHEKYYAGGWHWIRLDGTETYGIADAAIRKDGVTYLGMAGEEKAAAEPVHMKASPTADIACGVASEKFAANWSYVTCPECDVVRQSVAAEKLKRATTSRCPASCSPLTPCRSHAGCPALREDAIAVRMADARKAKEEAEKGGKAAASTSSRGTSYIPSPSGLGGAVGPVLSQRARR